MIKSNYTTALAAGLVSVLSIGAVLPSGAQHGPRDYQRTALTAIKEGKWQEALDAVDRCIRVYEPRIKMLGLDDGFGWFYYQKGVCLAQLKITRRLWKRSRLVTPSFRALKTSS